MEHPYIAWPELFDEICILRFIVEQIDQIPGT